LLATTLCFAILLRHTSNPVRFRLLVFMIVSVALASALFGLARTVLTHPVFSCLYPDRSFCQFVNRNQFALLVEVGLRVLFGLGTSRAAPAPPFSLFRSRRSGFVDGSAVDPFARCRRKLYG